MLQKIYKYVYTQLAESLKIFRSWFISIYICVQRKQKIFSSAWTVTQIINKMWDIKPIYTVFFVTYLLGTYFATFFFVEIIFIHKEMNDNLQQFY